MKECYVMLIIILSIKWKNCVMLIIKQRILCYANN